MRGRACAAGESGCSPRERFLDLAFRKSRCSRASGISSRRASGAAIRPEKGDKELARLDVEHVAQLPEPDLVEYPSLPKPREDFLLFPNGLDPNQLPRQLEDSDLMSQGLERRGEGYWCHICALQELERSRKRVER